MPWEPKISDSELAEAVVNIQKRDPLATEASICVELGTHRDYLNRRSKASDIVANARKVADRVREEAWVKEGRKGMAMGKDFNATVYIWMTRNILKWTDNRGTPATLEEGPDGKPRLIVDLSGKKEEE